MLDAYRSGTSPSATETSKLWTRLGVPVVAPVTATSAVLKIVLGAAVVVGGGAVAIASVERAPERARVEVVERSVAPARETAPTIEPAVLPEAIASIATPSTLAPPVRASTPERVPSLAPE